MPAPKVVKATAAIIACVSVVALLAILMFALRPESPADPEVAQVQPTADDAEDGEWLTYEGFVDAQISELFDVDELHSVPDGYEVSESVVSNALRNVEIPRGNRRLANLRELIPADELGGFLHPRISPDGLQIMLTRAGYQGIYVVPASGGDPELIASVNAWGARWTDDGRIEVTDHDGTKRLFGLDGTLEEITRVEPEDRLFYSDDDVIYARTEPGAPAQPLTANNDVYIQPIPSPDGSHVAYLGLDSGLFVARADGTGDPIYLGMGNNPAWTQDGSGIVFDMTVDDGHHMVSGDIYFAGGNFTELSNLTEGESHVGQFPSIGPDGQTVVFESDGSIYEGTLQ